VSIKTPTNETELNPERRRELLDTLRTTVAEAEAGSEEALDAVAKILEESPDFARFFANLANTLERSYAERISCGSPVAQKALPVRLETMRGEIAGPGSLPLERLLAERIVACWLELHYANLLYMQELPNLSLKQDDYYQKRLDRLNKRYLASIKNLAQVRKYLKPNFQVNIAERQIVERGHATAST
jgi:uncharacterized protein YllA (UPF0747 family)